MTGGWRCLKLSLNHFRYVWSRECGWHFHFQANSRKYSQRRTACRAEWCSILDKELQSNYWGFQEKLQTFLIRCCWFWAVPWWLNLNSFWIFTFRLISFQKQPEIAERRKTNVEKHWKTENCITFLQCLLVYRGSTGKTHVQIKLNAFLYIFLTTLRDKKK